MDPAFIIGIVALSLTGTVCCVSLASIIINLGKVIRNNLKPEQTERQKVERQDLLEHPATSHDLKSIPEEDTVDYNAIL